MQETKTSNGPGKQLPRFRRAVLPYMVLSLGLLFTFLVSYYFSRLAEEQDQSRFKSSVREIDDRIKAKIQTSIALLRAGTGLFAASDRVRADEFVRFVDQIELQKNYPGILGIGYSRRIPAAEMTRVIATMHEEGVADFKVWPDYQRDEYHSILYLAPPEPPNKLAIGFDMFTDPTRRQAMEHARDTGLPSASGRVVLVQEQQVESKQAGFLIYVPVYRRDADTSDLKQRRQALEGFVYSPFRADDFIKSIFGDTQHTVDFMIYDGDQQTSENLLHSSVTEASGSKPPAPHFVTTFTEHVGDRPWTLAFSTNAYFESSSSRTFLPYIFGAGVLLSWLFFEVTRVDLRARANAERFAAEVRESEAKIRKTLEERAVAEAAMRESEERYRELVENANDIVYTLDFDGRITSINKAAELITEYSQDELLKANIADILSEDSLATGRQMLGSRTAQRERTNYEIAVLSKTGRVVTLEVSSRLIYKGLEPIGIQGIARDITTRRRAEEALREADQRALTEYERLLERISSLSQTLGTARDLITIFRGLREFTRVSAPCDGFFVSLYDPIHDVRSACYGWGDEVELDVTDLPPMPVTTAGPNSRAVRTGQVIITDDYMLATRGRPSVIVGPDNGLRPQSSMAVPMAVMGRIVGTIELQSYRKSAYLPEHVTAMSMAANLTAVAVENIALLKRESSAREAAEESNRLKDEFLATVSHELRTPLTAILGWSRMLEGDSLDETVSRQAIATIWRNAKAQAQIVDDILDVSRIITGNLYLDLHPIELAPVVEAAINVVRPTAEAKAIRIETDISSLPLVISGDNNRLQQVIWNLLSNAVKFTPTGGRLRVSLQHVGESVEISVSDSGQGISRTFLPFVFDRFRQADSSTTRQHGGLGLGLAIARHLVEIHGGSIRAESAGEGQGSTFTIKLPLIDSTARAADLSSTLDTRVEPEDTLKGISVLLVDDDPDTLELMTTALANRQATVTAVLSAGDAMQNLLEHQPDVLISDIAMPGEDGYELIQKVRSIENGATKTIPAIAITAYAKDEDRERALSSGFQMYLAKPVELNELVDAVARAARRQY